MAFTDVTNSISGRRTCCEGHQQQHQFWGGLLPGRNLNFISLGVQIWFQQSLSAVPLPMLLNIIIYPRALAQQQHLHPIPSAGEIPSFAK